MAPKRKATKVPTDLTESEQDLLWHIQNGYQLETDSLGSDLRLRRLKDNEVIRPVSANRNTVKALEERGLITAAKSDDPLTIVWRLNKGKAQQKKPTAIRHRPRFWALSPVGVEKLGVRMDFGALP
jgi:hypothetical protein